MYSCFFFTMFLIIAIFFWYTVSRFITVWSLALNFWVIFQYISTSRDFSDTVYHGFVSGTEFWISENIVEWSGMCFGIRVPTVLSLFLLLLYPPSCLSRALVHSFARTDEYLPTYCAYTRYLFFPHNSNPIRLMIYTRTMLVRHEPYAYSRPKKNSLRVSVCWVECCRRRCLWWCGGKQHWLLCGWGADRVLSIKLTSSHLMSLDDEEAGGSITGIESNRNKEDTGATLFLWRYSYLEVCTLQHVVWILRARIAWFG